MNALPARKASSTVSSNTPVYTMKAPTGQSPQVYYETQPRVGSTSGTRLSGILVRIQAAASQHYVYDPRMVPSNGQENYKTYSAAGPPYIAQPSPTQLVHTYAPNGGYYPVGTGYTTVSRGGQPLPSRMSVLTKQQPPSRQLMQPLIL